MGLSASNTPQIFSSSEGTVGCKRKRTGTLASAKDTKRRKELYQNLRETMHEGISSYFYCFFLLVSIHYNYTLESEFIDLTAQPDIFVYEPTDYWIKDLKLLPGDKECLSRGKWLTDSLINAVQSLLRNQYPHIGGLQSTSLGETLSFETQRKEFAQVLNIGGYHWVTISKHWISTRRSQYLRQPTKSQST